MIIRGKNNDKASPNSKETLLPKNRKAIIKLPKRPVNSLVRIVTRCSVPHFRHTSGL